MHSLVLVIYDSISQVSETKWSQIVLGWESGGLAVEKHSHSVYNP